MKNDLVASIQKRLAFLCVLLVLLLLVSVWLGDLQAQVSKPQDVPEDGSQPKTTKETMALPEDYIIGPDDVLNLYLLDVPELSRDYRVSASGTVTIPTMAKPINATGLTLPNSPSFFPKN